VTQRPAQRPRAARPVAVRKPAGPVVTYLGKEYRVAADMGVWPLMQFARAAEMGESLREMKGLASLHAMLENVIHEDDWPQFQDDMIAAKIKDPLPLLELANQGVRLIQEHLDKSSSNGHAT
jgi:hypothetical protein